jgi:hypothetical protein
LLNTDALCIVVYRCSGGVLAVVAAWSGRLRPAAGQ